jgi:hypothetical protein
VRVGVDDIKALGHNRHCMPDHRCCQGRLRLIGSTVFLI